MKKHRRRPGHGPEATEGLPGEPGELPGALPGESLEGGENVPGVWGRPGGSSGHLPPGRPEGPVHGGEETEPGTPVGRPPGTGRVEQPDVGDGEIPGQKGEPGRGERSPVGELPREPVPGEGEGGPRRAGEPDVERASGKRDALIDELLCTVHLKIISSKTPTSNAGVFFGSGISLEGRPFKTR